jgi:hypothetical protein
VGQSPDSSRLYSWYVVSRSYKSREENMLWVGPQAKASCMVSNWSPKEITEYILRGMPCLEALKFNIVDKG